MFERRLTTTAAATLLILVASCSHDIPPDLANTSLWTRTVGEYLKGPLWQPDEAYDAGHALMVPLHAAFQLDNPAAQGDFGEHFDRFVDQSADLTGNRIGRFQYLYLASRFLALATKADREDLVPRGLPEFLADEVARVWQSAPAWQWDREPFVGVRERVAWKLSSSVTEPSYYRAITDETLYLLAIAADLETVSDNWPAIREIDNVLEEMLDYAFRIFTSEIVLTSNGGWLLQPGVWEDHRDYAYAGHTEKMPGLLPMPVPGISWDSAHFHRMAAWLSSFEHAACNARPAEAEWYSFLLMGLEKQFLSVVLALPTADFPAYRLTNFMDGWNGIYRWGHVTQGENNGYGPYELSGMFLYGWWSFLGTQRVSAIHARQANTFPLPDHVVETYVGPNTTRTRNPLMRHPDFFTNGFAQIIMTLASSLPTHTGCPQL